jgi:hypothetical protein
LQAPHGTAIQTVVLAPIALFVYCRPEHTRRTLEALARCPEWKSSQVVVYADGAKKPEFAAAVAETRRVVRELAPHATVIEQPANRGLARSIIAGTTELCERFGRVIVVEDDLEVAPGFLTFLNAGLDLPLGGLRRRVIQEVLRRPQLALDAVGLVPEVVRRKLAPGTSRIVADHEALRAKARS